MEAIFSSITVKLTVLKEDINKFDSNKLTKSLLHSLIADIQGVDARIDNLYEVYNMEIHYKEKEAFLRKEYDRLEELNNQLKNENINLLGALEKEKKSIKESINTQFNKKVEKLEVKDLIFEDKNRLDDEFTYKAKVCNPQYYIRNYTTIKTKILALKLFVNNDLDYRGDKISNDFKNKRTANFIKHIKLLEKQL